MKAILLAAVAVVVATPALAQRDIPIQRDLDRMDRLDRRLDREGVRRERPRRLDPNVTPDNPDGVVGFDGPPFNYGDPGVMGDAPLPPGSPADIDDE